MVVKIVDLVEVWRGGGNRWNVRVTLLIWMLTKTPSDSHVRINNDKHLHNDVANYDIILIPRAHTLQQPLRTLLPTQTVRKGPSFGVTVCLTPRPATRSNIATQQSGRWATSPALDAHVHYHVRVLDTGSIEECAPREGGRAFGVYHLRVHRENCRSRNWEQCDRGGGVACDFPLARSILCSLVGAWHAISRWRVQSSVFLVGAWHPISRWRVQSSVFPCGGVACDFPLARSILCVPLYRLKLWPHLTSCATPWGLLLPWWACVCECVCVCVCARAGLCDVF